MTFLVWKLNYMKIYLFMNAKTSYVFLYIPGTTIMHIPREDGDQWAFKEDGPEGYIGLSHDANNVIFTFLKSPDLEEINNGTSEAN